MYDELVEELRRPHADCDPFALMDKAADAIEKLEAYCDLYKECGEKLLATMQKINEERINKDGEA